MSANPSEAGMRLVEPVVVEILKAAARERLEKAAQFRADYLRGHFQVHDKLAKQLEHEAAAIEHAIEVIGALSFQ